MTTLLLLVLRHLVLSTRAPSTGPRAAEEEQ